MASVDKKLLRDLPIHDIKTELAKRNVDTNGMKSVLTERLKKALVDEGEDPNVFLFDVSNVANNEVSQAGDNVGGAGGHGQDVGEENDDFDEENPGNDNEDLNSTAGSQRSPSAAKPGTTTPAKGKKNQSSTVREGGDDSFVLQEDDNVLSDIDADLLEGKAGGLREAGDNNGDTNSGQDNSAATDTSANLVENSDSKDDNTTSGSKDENDTKTMAKSSTATATDEKSAQPGRNLWVSGLSYRVRAADLKTLFSKHGKVVAAKIVTSSRTAVARYFGLVTMSTDEEATKCAQLLHRRNLLGRIISVEKAKTETQGTETKILPPSALKPPARPPYRARRPVPKPDDKKEGEPPTTPSKETELTETDAKDVVSFSKIKADQEQERLRRKEMFLEREKYKQHMIEKRHREEAFRIDRERRRLREMREELERQHIETERMRLETERLHMEREQEKYRREQQRVLQARRALKRRGPRDEEWPTKRFHGGDRYESAQGDREFNRRGDEPRTFREERPNRPNTARGPPRHQESRSQWKSEREVRTGGGWNGPVDHSKGEEEWDAGNIGQGDGWDNGGMNQSASGYGLQQGQNSGAGYTAQPSMQGGMMHGGRQNDGRYGMSAASSRRF